MSIDGFPIKHRLTQSSQFEAVFKQADYRIPNGPVLLIARQNQLNYNRLGLIVGKKAISLATQRNKVKRLLRESFRRQYFPIDGYDLIILVRKGLANLDNKAIGNLAAALWQELLRQHGIHDTSKVTKTR